jgi:hypothetical protein
MLPSGIDPAIFWFVAQCLNRCATACSSNSTSAYYKVRTKTLRQNKYTHTHTHRTLNKQSTYNVVGKQCKRSTKAKVLNPEKIHMMIKGGHHFYYFCGAYVTIQDRCRPAMPEKTSNLFTDNLKPDKKIRIIKTHKSDENRQV